MMDDREFQRRVRVAFHRLNNVPADSAFSRPTIVRTELEALIPSGNATTVNVGPKVAALFATASVDMWLRGVHSFLVSASLTNASPIWASATGYYASHYAVRGLAHLLGYFLLFTRKRVVQLGHNPQGHFCSFTKKSADDREHKLYWKQVKGTIYFQDDPLFTENSTGTDVSDVRHRDHANYADSLFPYPNFRAIDLESLKNRVAVISRIEIVDPPIPRVSEFADLDNVQLVAYHRLVRYRKFLDEILADTSRFWNVHRNPHFATNILNFQVTESSGLSMLRAQ
jgi:hypothetical protein